MTAYPKAVNDFIYTQLFNMKCKIDKKSIKERFEYIDSMCDKYLLVGYNTIERLAEEALKRIGRKATLPINNKISQFLVAINYIDALQEDPHILTVFKIFLLNEDSITNDIKKNIIQTMWDSIQKFKTDSIILVDKSANLLFWNVFLSKNFYKEIKISENYTTKDDVIEKILSMGIKIEYICFLLTFKENYKYYERFDKSHIFPVKYVLPKNHHSRHLDIGNYIDSDEKLAFYFKISGIPPCWMILYYSPNIMELCGISWAQVYDNKIGSAIEEQVLLNVILEGTTDKISSNTIEKVIPYIRSSILWNTKNTNIAKITRKIDMPVEDSDKYDIFDIFIKVLIKNKYDIVGLIPYLFSLGQYSKCYRILNQCGESPMNYLLVIKLLNKIVYSITSEKPEIWNKILKVFDIIFFNMVDLSTSTLCKMTKDIALKFTGRHQCYNDRYDFTARRDKNIKGYCKRICNCVARNKIFYLALLYSNDVVNIELIKELSSIGVHMSDLELYKIPYDSNLYKSIYPSKIPVEYISKFENEIGKNIIKSRIITSSQVRNNDLETIEYAKKYSKRGTRFDCRNNIKIMIRDKVDMDGYTIQQIYENYPKLYKEFSSEYIPTQCDPKGQEYNFTSMEKIYKIK